MTPAIAKSISKFIDLSMRPSPLFRFLHHGWGRCRVPGCGKFTGRNRYGKLKLICRKHQGSPKFQKLAKPVR